MRLRLTLPEIEAGVSVQNGTTDRINELRRLSGRRGLIPIHPVVFNGKTIALIMLIDEAFSGTGNRSLKIFFEPIWCKTFTLYERKGNKLLALVCEFRQNTYWIDLLGVREAKVSTKGNGCDPLAVERAETTLGDMIAEDNMVNMSQREILRITTAFIQRGFVPTTTS